MSATPRATSSRYAAAIASLGRPADIRALPLPAMHLVMAMRLCALFEQAGREPIVELTGRFGSVTLAEQVLALSRMIGRAWPEPYGVSRPCCLRMTPDERTLASMVRRAMAGDRAGFASELDGFVRPVWHEPLYDHAVECVALLSSLQQQRA
ncbi:MAG: hypothetical protein M0R03_07070 [Novosphingobium sp.]|nr:hypothetical protein [Novosphingobium sp.]